MRPRRVHWVTAPAPIPCCRRTRHRLLRRATMVRLCPEEPRQQRASAADELPLPRCTRMMVASSTGAAAARTGRRTQGAVAAAVPRSSLDDGALPRGCYCWRTPMPGSIIITAVATAVNNGNNHPPHTSTTSRPRRPLPLPLRSTLRRWHSTRATPACIVSSARRRGPTPDPVSSRPRRASRSLRPSTWRSLRQDQDRVPVRVLAG